MGYTYSLWHGVQEHKLFAKRIFAGVMAVLFAGSIAAAMSASADTHAPSTNDANLTNGWAYVEVDSADGLATLTFNSTRDFQSCFEYRTDGEETQSTGENYNPAADGLYPFVCVQNSTETVEVAAEEYVEVRTVFGAESDERFEWTRFEVEQPVDTQNPVSEITAPTDGGVVDGTVEVRGSVTDDNDLLQYYAVVLDSNNDVVAGPGTVQVTETFTDTLLFNWDTTDVEDGEYTIRLASRDAAGNKGAESVDEVTVTVNNVVENKDECKNSGWTLGLTDREFRNQGDCVSHFASANQRANNPDGARNQNARR